VWYYIVTGKNTIKCLEANKMEKTYMETRKAIKELVLTVGLNGIYNYHLNELREQGHTGTHLQNAINYFQYSPNTAKYRMGG